jgi:UPF0271 protein
MKYVLDTSAILSGKDFSADFELFTSPKILDELKPGRMKRRLDYLLESGLKVMSPSKEAIETVEDCAKKTGDSARVTDADIEILSLALELEATVLSDDYSIQNLASILNVKFQGIAQEGITKVIEWRFRCKGCGRFWEEMHDSCPVCGSELKTIKKK